MIEELEGEIWKPICGYEGLYKVSSMGRVKSLNRIIKKSNGINITIKECIRKPILTKQGYLHIHLHHSNGTEITKSLHQLVSRAFIPNPYNKTDVNHKNGIKTDNRIDNLEWCDDFTNMKHAFELGLISRKGSKNSRAILNENDVILIRNEFQLNSERGSQQRLSKKFNVSKGVISRIILRKTWTHI